MELNAADRCRSSRMPPSRMVEVMENGRRDAMGLRKVDSLCSCFAIPVFLRPLPFPTPLILNSGVGRSLQKVMHKVGKNRSEEPRCRRSRSDPSSCSSGDGTPSCSGLDASKSYDGTMEGRRHKMCNYRSQLEEED
ncbi:hypothetical protein ZIOFF_073369 [Zingiber officinale]|uniref:Uncharacterized protein n=1 Tax=Zingiber officinale TaxID=94328 RepID=A0A8J5EP81_ZINOF|nr:hypothetical protein ZIOFF_073369 [Zingiber officinale]